MTLGESDSEKVRRIVSHIQADEGVVNDKILKIAAQDVSISPHESSLLQEEKDRKPETFYSDLVYTLAHIRMEEPKARKTWSEIIKHKYEMSVAVKRNVGIRVAALDYFQNLKGVVDDVRIVDTSEYIETKRLVVTDGLTGLFNHRYFYERLSILMRLVSEGKMRSIGLMVIDLDYFKQYNDANGHLAGDIVLVETAHIFTEAVGSRGSAFRYGGEEFAVLVPDFAATELKAMAETIRQKVMDREFVNEAVLPGGQVTVSIGLSLYPDICSELNHFFRTADEALYMAKKLGRNRVMTAEG